MNRYKTIELLKQHRPVMASRFGVIEFALFGSTARDSAQPGSDVDILVGFAGKATSAQYFGVQFYLEDLFGCTVDLITQKHCAKNCAPLLSVKRFMSDNVATREWRFYIDDMIGFCERVLVFTADVDNVDF